MRNEFATQRYDVHLPVEIQVRGQGQIDGVTDYISSQDIRFAVNQDFAMKPGTPVTLFVAVPREITAGNPVVIRAHGRVQRVECVSDTQGIHSTFTAAVNKYDFVRRSDGVKLAPVEGREVA